MPHLADVTIAKNYLTEAELRYLNNMVSGYFDFAENQAAVHQYMYMEDYVKLLDNIIIANGKPVLDNAGAVSAVEAREKAVGEYRKYQVRELSPVEKKYFESVKALKQATKK